MHRTVIAGIAIRRGARGQANEDLPSIERHRTDGILAHRPPLKASIGELDAHQPIEHAPSAVVIAIIAGAAGEFDHRGDDVARRLRIRTRPAIQQGEMTRDPAVGARR